MATPGVNNLTYRGPGLVIYWVDELSVHRNGLRPPSQSPNLKFGQYFLGHQFHDNSIRART
ncbi:hypothetical protein K443DRAFT_683810 [Laccaria amethystina LaAM-08-1]|uniref:Uncharacterized protein n=1 Tax=Laccaria amethystina LaAM-08-1 TaxID=1095629 RepID=A0A0C9WS10_9AGAR|nr:hypothetical protein K443DRAFT_683810 [Laccaria amethystina LaAM-08-1]